MLLVIVLAGGFVLFVGLFYWLSLRFVCLGWYLYVLYLVFCFVFGCLCVVFWLVGLVGDFLDWLLCLYLLLLWALLC